jgi:hypothetical protein
MRARAWAMANTRQAEMQDSEERNEQFAPFRVPNTTGIESISPALERSDYAGDELFTTLNEITQKWQAFLRYGERKR